MTTTLAAFTKMIAEAQAANGSDAYLDDNVPAAVVEGFIAFVRDADPPALQPAMSGFQKWLVAVMLRLAPGLRVGNGLNADDLSHDRAVVQAYRADRLNHDRISARLAHFLAVEGEQVMAAAPRWSTPTLLLYAGSDRLVMPEGSEAFARAAAPTGQVSARGFAGMFHELFNEAEPAPAFDAMRDWITARLDSKVFDSEDQRCRRALILGSPALQAHERSNLARFQALLAEGVAADLGVPADSLRARLVSAAAVAALHALGRADDVANAIERYGIDASVEAPWRR